MTLSSATDRASVLENAGGSRHFSLAGEFFESAGRALTDARVALLVLLASTLAVVSCATLVERNAAPSIAIVEPAPLAVPPPAAPEMPPAGTDPLAQRRLIVPVRGAERSQLQDNFDTRRGRRMHNALDIRAQRGTPVIAADDGRVVRVYRHALGGLCVYQYDPQENFVYYYAHMDGFAAGLREGALVSKGDVLGYVGTTGNASPTAPHLHFAIYRLGPERRWWRGTPINPYPYLAGPERAVAAPTTPARASP